jgi:hypothetical protein
VGNLQEGTTSTDGDEGMAVVIRVTRRPSGRLRHTVAKKCEQEAVAGKARSQAKRVAKRL